MWNADKAAYLNVFTSHGSSVTCGDFTPDGKIICSGSNDATMRIWNPRTGEIIHVVGETQCVILQKDLCTIFKSFCFSLKQNLRLLGLISKSRRGGSNAHVTDF